MFAGSIFMNTNNESDATLGTNQYEICCPQCTVPALLVDGSAVAGVLLDDFEHECGFRGVINWSSPLATDPHRVPAGGGDLVSSQLLTADSPKWKRIEKLA
jgi:hypothetical protein